MDLLHGLNAAQKAAVTSDAAVLQVLAPPGSGKTKTLTARVAYLIAHRSLKPWNIITCTFTRKAANEMKERIRTFVGEEHAKQIKLGTFHAIAVQYLRQYGQHIGLGKDFGIADSSDSKAVLKRIIKRNSFTIEPGAALSRISSQKVRGINSEQLALKAKHIEQQEFAQIFAEYETELKASNLLDYDDLLLQCCFLMTTHPQCVSNVEAVLIDEFQDTNTTQYDLMRLFAQKRNMITIVGDPDQSIYSFRSAEIQNLTRMKEHWPDTLTINLEENYRSSGAILHAAQNIIEQDESRPPKKLQATHGLGLCPVLRKLPTAAAEATWLVSEIQRMCALSGKVVNPSDCAVLLRSAALSRMIEAALSKAGVPYRMVGGVRFFERAEVKLVLDYLRVINQPDNNEAVERIINVPSRRIGDATIKGLLNEAKAKSTSFWTFIREVSQGKCRSKTKLAAPAEKGLASFVNIILSGRRKLTSVDSDKVSVVDLINLVIKKADLQAYLKNHYENEYEARWSNIEELMALAADACDPDKVRAMMQEETLPAIDGFEQRAPTEEDALSIFLANVALTASAEEKKADGEESEPVQQVTISTIHSAKGLEWPVVFIPACFDGSIPHSRSDDNDEERRLLYVGMTRAQAMLYLSCPIKNTQREDTTMSSFLTQPGVGSFFEEHGPSMSFATATGLATTLKRDRPSHDAFQDGKKSLERDEDDYWPLNGEEPPAERAKWDYGRAENPLPAFGTTRPASWMSVSAVSMGQEGFSSASATMSAGFVSVKDKYDELVERDRLAAIDKRSQVRRKESVEASKGRKRQIEGQGCISTFFAKRRAVATDLEQERDKSFYTREPASVQPALRDISNLGVHRNVHSQSLEQNPLSKHKLRNAPYRAPTTTTQVQSSDRGYVFLSSSPTKTEEEENQPSEKSICNGTERDVDPVKQASTFHTTSVQSLQQNAVRGRRLGVRPSFNGWANRGRK
ncbi:P-loop containing nucleoside triphosphate hydrolase protein [Neohortaea acidophila]|uniref:DNA 3'-5' helicase n=1 Tax=Neohortaea acidophila TaxID=245834 RepID=A0A6A6Q3R4_9PEZI|nr:P-loop containing nucleoside triphosphate hydrolase protein [Neohortaea acidophila]KAF2486691.1 P-loop containing nucleoside triphosphate hydrolase protein [Neohortaea acidophila]